GQVRRRASTSAGRRRPSFPAPNPSPPLVRPFRLPTLVGLGRLERMPSEKVPPGAYLPHPTDCSFVEWVPTLPCPREDRCGRSCCFALSWSLADPSPPPAAVRPASLQSTGARPPRTEELRREESTRDAPYSSSDCASP